ncbi:MAG: S8 family peptidase [Lachnospiraceae bacterium]|nr:S8 family peptidase [Lachnospiraceae bacterium]
MNRVRKQVGCSDHIQEDIITENVAVAVLDTGIGTHPDFDNRIIAFADFVNGRQGSYDDSGHGTHVAGCVGGSGYASRRLYRGMAPACRLCIGKVLDHNGEGSIDSMYRGLMWVLQNRIRYQIRVLNVSLGIGNSGEKDRMEELIGLLDAVWEQGIVVVCAAGNNGPREGTISPLGSSRKVITVGCHEGGYFGARRDLCENYSGRGGRDMLYRKPDVVAPGTDIISCNIHCRGNYRFGYRNAYIKKSGTSMATPIVSGASALFLQKYPYMNNEQVKRKMIYSARDMGDAWSKQGWGMLNLEEMFSSG